MIKHKGTEKIETERLIMRKFNIYDSEYMYKNWSTDSAVCKFLSWNPHSCLSETEEIVNFWIDAYASNNNYNWVIELKDLGEIIGQISVMNLNEKYCSCSVGYNLGRAFWRKGIMTEALKAIINFMLNEVGLNRLEATHNTLNLASGRVMQKAGMKFEGILRQVKVGKNGQFYDLAVYSILKSDLL